MRAFIQCLKLVVGDCLLAALLGCVFLLPLSARAELSPVVGRYLLSAKQLLEDLEYERALEQVTRAKKVSKTPEDDVAVSLYEGIVLAELGSQKRADAAAAFKAALFIDPNAKLPVAVSPKVMKRFEAVRKEVQSELARNAPPATPGPPPAPDAPPQELLGEKKGEEPPTQVATQDDSLRRKALIPAIVGGVLLAAGGGAWGMSQAQKAKLRQEPTDLETHQEATDVGARGRTYQTVGFGLMGAGVVGLGVAASMYLLGAPDEAVSSLGVSTDGRSAFVYGRWP